MSAFAWILYSPIGAYLGSGVAATKEKAEADAVSALSRKGRKRGTVKVFPRGMRGNAFPSKPVSV